MKDENVTIDFKSFLKRGKEIPLDDDQKEKIRTTIINGLGRFLSKEIMARLKKLTFEELISVITDDE